MDQQFYLEGYIFFIRNFWNFESIEQAFIGFLGCFNLNLDYDADMQPIKANTWENVNQFSGLLMIGWESEEADFFCQSLESIVSYTAVLCAVTQRSSPHKERLRRRLTET